MLGFGSARASRAAGVSARLCADRFNGKYPHVGLYDCRERKVWVAKPLNGQAIRMSHAALITGADNATSTVWKDRFLCFWFYTPRTGEGYIHGYPIDWDDAHLLVRIDPPMGLRSPANDPSGAAGPDRREPRTANAPRRAHLGILQELLAEVPHEPALHRAAGNRFAVLRKATGTSGKVIPITFAIDEGKLYGLYVLDRLYRQGKIAEDIGADTPFLEG